MKATEELQRSEQWIEFWVQKCLLVSVCGLLTWRIESVHEGNGMFPDSKHQRQCRNCWNNICGLNIRGCKNLETLVSVLREELKKSFPSKFLIQAQHCLTSMIIRELIWDFQLDETRTFFGALFWGKGCPPVFTITGLSFSAPGQALFRQPICSETVHSAPVQATPMDRINYCLNQLEEVFYISL